MTAVSQPRDDTEKRVFLICHRSERSEVKRSRESMDCHVANAPRNDGKDGLFSPSPYTLPLQGGGKFKAGDPLTQGAGTGHPERDDGGRRVLLICHRSERSEVKRSGESMGAAWSGRSLDSGCRSRAP
ncbi:MAG: hypothetical protein NC218_12170 [Acetobacter sp.]|nr:hypothetical protein [Acetobacter sp.]